jgi:hypothetical protein
MRVVVVRKFEVEVEVRGEDVRVWGCVRVLSTDLQF